MQALFKLRLYYLIKQFNIFLIDFSVGFNNFRGDGEIMLLRLAEFLAQASEVLTGASGLVTEAWDIITVAVDAVLAIFR